MEHIVKRDPIALCDDHVSRRKRRHSEIFKPLWLKEFIYHEHAMPVKKKPSETEIDITILSAAVVVE